MSTTNFRNPSQPSLTLLSQDLEALVFEFLPLSDFPSLQLVSKRCYQTLQRYPKLWAQHLFSNFLEPSRDLDDILEEDIYDGIPLISEDHFFFDEMTTSKTIIQNYHIIRSHLENSLRRVLSKGPAKSLTRALTNTLRTPEYPVPYLKRDIHFFETNSLFQNFLTEVFFEIQARSIPNDKKQTLIRTIIHKLKESHNCDSITEKDLLLLQQNPCDKLKDLREAKTADNEVQNGQVARRPGPFNFVERFYSIMHKLVQNRCEMILACLGAIKTPKELLSEYCRLWFGFAMTVMEMNRSLVPFTQFMNDLYKKKCTEAENVPEFSVWKFMVSLWRNIVFEPLSGQLFEAFITMLSTAREEERTSKDTGTSEQLERTLHPFAEPAADSVEVESEDLKILKAFYNGLGDLSYSQVTIFYWKCVAIGEETPKGMLDHKIVQNLLTFYRSKGQVWTDEPLELIELLKDDLKMIETVFGRELALRVEESQVEFIRCFLADHLVSVCDSLATSSSHDEYRESGQTFETGSLEYLFKALDIQELLQSKISSSDELKRALSTVLEKEQKRLFDPLLTHHNKLKERLAAYYQENQEIYLNMVERGFGQLEEEEEEKALFILTDDRTKEH